MGGYCVTAVNHKSDNTVIRKGANMLFFLIQKHILK